MKNNKENIINNIPEFPNDYIPSFDISILSNNIPNNIISYFNTILYSLEISFNYIDKNYRIKCEKYLKLNEEKILSFFDYVQILIKSKILTKNISNAFIIYIRNSITNNKNNLNKEILIKLIKILIDCIIDLNFPEYCLKEMNKCFEESINSELFEKNGDYLIELLNLFENKIFNKNNNNNIINVSYKGLAYIYENILCSLGVNKNNSENIIKIILNCTDFMINDNINKIKNNNFNVINENFYDEIKVIYSLLLNISYHIQKTFDNFYLFKEILYTKFLNYGLNFLYLNVSNNNNIKNELKMKTKIFRFLISLIKKHIDNNQIFLNILKQYITFSINYFNDNNNFKNCFFILFNDELNDNNNNSDTINIILNKFIQQILYFLSIILYNELFYFNYQLIDFINFAKKIIFPFFISNKKEINDISNDKDGTNYANYIYDIILERKNKCLKSALAKFVYIGCKKNENYLKFYLIYSIELIEYSINNNNAITNVYDNNSFISKDDFLIINNEIKTENRIEIGLIILCIICKVIEKKENKNYYIEILLNFTKNFCNNINDMANKFIIIKERICLFFSIYLDLFIDYINCNNNNNELLINISDFLFINIFNEKNDNNNLIGIYESYEAIKKIIINKNINNNNNNILYSISSKYSILFIKFIPSSNFPLFFEVLTYISKYINDNNILLSLLNSLFNRIVKEISPRRLSHDQEGNNNMNNSYKIIINNCFNVIREIFYKKTFIQNYFNEIEKFILPLLKYMKYPTKIEFDEDIVLIITIIIKTINFLPNIFFNIFPELYLYLKKNGGMTLDLFELINLYIININNPNNNYNNDDINNNLISYKNIDNNKILFKLFKKSLAKNIKHINSPYLSSLLIQIWLIYISNIPNNILISIISFSLKYIKNILLIEKSNHSEDTNNNINNKLILFSLTNIIFVGFINYPIITINNIEIEDIIKSLLLISSFDVVSVYQIKVIIISICYVLKNKNIIENFNEFGIVLLDVSFKLLKKIKKYETKSLKKKEIKDIKNNLIDNEEDENENEDDDSMENSINDHNNNNNNNEDLILNICEENFQSQSYNNNNDDIIFNNNNNNNLNIENIIEDYTEIDYRTINPKIKELDEFKIFKESIEILNKNNNSFFLNWFNKLSDKKKEDFKDIINTFYLETTTNDNNNINIPRRIVKIKNNNNK